MGDRKYEYQQPTVESGDESPADYEPISREPVYQEPVYLTDSLGRTFSCPFAIAQTWTVGCLMLLGFPCMY